MGTAARSHSRLNRTGLVYNLILRQQNLRLLLCGQVRLFAAHIRGAAGHPYRDESRSKEVERMASMSDGEDGQGLVEYALILTLVAIVAVVGLSALGQSIADTFDGIVDALSSASQAGTEEADDPDLWEQPAGAHDAYANGDVVTHDGRVWESLMDGNAWEPGQVGTWRDQSTPPLWVVPAGAIGLWHAGDRVEHNGAVWRSTIDNNAWAPGVHGWEIVE